MLHVYDTAEPELSGRTSLQALVYFCLCCIEKSLYPLPFFSLFFCKTVFMLTEEVLLFSFLVKPTISYPIQHDAQLFAQGRKLKQKACREKPAGGKAFISFLSGR